MNRSKTPISAIQFTSRPFPSSSGNGEETSWTEIEDDLHWIESCNWPRERREARMKRHERRLRISSTARELQKTVSPSEREGHARRRIVRYNYEGRYLTFSSFPFLSSYFRTENLAGPAKISVKSSGGDFVISTSNVHSRALDLAM